MKFPSMEQIERLRKQYPAGTVVELVEMQDSQAPPAGTLGTVLGMDDAGSVLCRWQNGSSLSIIPEVDSFCVVKEAHHE